MKTTKTIEIEICDICGEETHPFKCASCKKEVCTRCRSYAHVHVQGLAPRSGKGWRSTSVKTVRQQYNGAFCSECADKIVDGLELLGLLASEDTSPMATMD